MSKYVLSDLHGCYKHFLAMLKKINFKETDTLYILGDIFDRGDDPLKIIEYVICHKNIIWIKGNHEEFFIDYYENHNTQLWDYNGGFKTRQKLLFKTDKYKDDLYNIVKNLPTIQVVDDKFILVHAGLFYPEEYKDISLKELLDMQNSEYNLWSRDNIGYEPQLDKYTVICGHTPVFTIENNRNTILNSNGTLYIDCGAVFNNHGGQLACLRLDDMTEFYVNYKESKSIRNEREFLNGIY